LNDPLHLPLSLSLSLLSVPITQTKTLPIYLVTIERKAKLGKNIYIYERKFEKAEKNSHIFFETESFTFFLEE
jgi:hypothetical protein